VCYLVHASFIRSWNYYRFVAARQRCCLVNAVLLVLIMRTAGGRVYISVLVLNRVKYSYFDDEYLTYSQIFIFMFVDVSLIC
jgi:hypothetical protein